MRRLLKRLVLAVPPIRRLHDQRNALLKINASLRQQIAEQEGFTAVGDQLPQEKQEPSAVEKDPILTSTDPFKTPIFILNFNQVSYLKKQINWFLRAGYTDLTVIDNSSTFPPLLEYYSAIHKDVNVIRLERNFGSRALWDAKILEQKRVDGPFIYTDSDVVPDEACPQDLISHLLGLLNQHPQILKVGPALRIDNLPNTYRFKNEVVTWESQFWKRPVARGLFMAPIDTTFALYRPGSAFVDSPALRTGWPYVARHEPWYTDSANLNEEQRYYAATAKGTHWTLNALPDWLRESVSNLEHSEKKTLLHLGCGHEYMPGWINLDNDPNVRADLMYDLNACAKASLPIRDNCVDGMFMCHVFEHIENTLDMMSELYRVAKPGTSFVIKLPHGASDDAHEDPTHRRAYFPGSFVYFAQPAYSRADYGYLGDWQIKRVRLVVDPGLLNSEGQDRLMERINTQRNVVQEMTVELIATKPQRPREFRLLSAALPTITGSMIDEEISF